MTPAAQQEKDEICLVLPLKGSFFEWLCTFEEAIANNAVYHTAYKYS
jgi:hypothetical protein